MLSASAISADALNYYSGDWSDVGDEADLAADLEAPLLPGTDGEHAPHVAEYMSPEYVVGSAERPGEWLGSAEALGEFGLAPGQPVDGQHLEAVLSGRHVETGETVLGTWRDSRGRTRPVPAPAGFYVREERVVAPLSDESTQVFVSGRAAADAEVEARAAAGRVATIERDPVTRAWSVADVLTDAVTGEPVMGERRLRVQQRGVTAWDLQASVPKSVSALYALGSEEQRVAIEQVVRQAMGQALTHIEQHAAQARTGAGGQGPRVDAGIPVAAAFFHRQSRDGQPQLHVHTLIANRQKCVDGKWRTLDSKTLLAEVRAAGTVFQASLRAGLSREFGVQWGPETGPGQREIAGAEHAQALLDAWSNRRAESLAKAERIIEQRNVQRAMQGLGPISPTGEREILQGQVKATRKSKAALRAALLQGQPQSIYDRWTDEAAVLGLPGSAYAEHLAEAARQPSAFARFTGDDALINAALDAAQSRHATISRRHVAREIAARIDPARTDPEHVAAVVSDLTEQALTSDRVVQVTWAQEDRVPVGITDPALVRDSRTEWWVTREALAVEAEIVDRAVLAMGQGRAVVDDEVLMAVLERTASRLDDEQRAALAAVTVSGDGVQVLDVATGADKSGLLAAASTAWQQSGHEVTLLAPTQAAATVARDRYGVQSSTVARAVVQWDDPQGQPQTEVLGRRERQSRTGTRADQPLVLTERSVVLVDEASLLGRDDMLSLVRAVTDARAKVVLIGDTSGLNPGASAPGMFQGLGSVLGKARVTRPTSMAAAWENEAVADLAVGRTAGVQAYAEQGRLVAEQTREDGLVRAHTLWAEQTAAGVDTLLVAHTAQDVQDLNRAARQTLVDRGLVAADAVRIGERDWAVGDVLRAGRDDGRYRYGADVAEVRAATARADKVAARLADLRDQKAAAMRKAAAENRRGRPAKRLHAQIDRLTEQQAATRLELETARSVRDQARATWSAASSVRAGERLRVESVTEAGIVARRLDEHGQVLTERRGGLLPGRRASAPVVLPSTYVEAHADYGYADTTRTVASASSVVVLTEPSMSREHLTHAVTRGSEATLVVSPARPVEPEPGQELPNWQVAQSEPFESDPLRRAEQAEAAVERIVGRSGRERTAAERMVEAALTEEALSSLARRRERINAHVQASGPGVDPDEMNAALAETVRLRATIERRAEAGIEDTAREQVTDRARLRTAQEKVALLEATQTGSASTETARDWAALLSRREEQRKDVLADRAEANPAVDLTSALGDRPTDAGETQTAWRTAARAWEGYRERWGEAPDAVVETVRTGAQAVEHAATEAARSALSLARSGLSAIRQAGRGFGR